MGLGKVESIYSAFFVLFFYFVLVSVWILASVEAKPVTIKINYKLSNYMVIC